MKSHEILKNIHKNAGAHRQYLTSKFGREKYIHLEGWESTEKKKFWEIRVEGCSLILRQGHVGKKGKKIRYDLGNEREALISAASRLWEKLNENYAEPDEAGKRLGAKQAYDEKRKKEREEEYQKEHQASRENPEQPLVWDLSDNQGPLRGRLRGVEARGEFNVRVNTQCKPEEMWLE